MFAKLLLLSSLAVRYLEARWQYGKLVLWPAPGSQRGCFQIDTGGYHHPERPTGGGICGELK